MSFKLFEVMGTHIFSMSAMSITLFFLFLIIIVGYFIGHISVKGVTLGSAAIFIVALFAGHFKGVAFENISAWQSSEAAVDSYFKLIQNLGLVLFVTSVGLIAGPTFFKNFVKNAKSFVLIGITTALAGALTTALIIKLVPNMDAAMGVGILSGALTSTPSFAAAQEAVGESLASTVSVGHAVAYPFGVIGIVLFVQLVPRILHADMDKERALINAASAEINSVKNNKKYKSFDRFGLAQYSLTVVLGLILGSINIPLGAGAFALGATGGPLIIGLIFGHFGHFGSFSLRADEKLLKIFQELGLILFLIGAGVDGGASFVSTLSEYGFMLFVWGAVITIVPLFISLFISRNIVKLDLFNALGALCGGRTSTPALGALISVTGTSDVATPYAATYPVALITIVLCAQFLTRM